MTSRWQIDDYDPRPSGTEDLPLFNTPAPSYPVDTSQDAAAKIQPIVGGMRWQVLRAVIASEDGLTTQEIEDVTGLKHQSASPRIWELARKMTPPLLEYSEAKRNGAHVVRATDAGRELYERLREDAA